MLKLRMPAARSPTCEQQAIAREAVQQVAPAAEKFRVLFTTLLKNVNEKASRYSFFKADLTENPFLLTNIVKKRDTLLEEQLKDILILGISRQEIKMMNNAEMGLWAKMVNLTIKSIGQRIFLEDDQYPDDQLAFLANALFFGVKA